MKKTMIILFSIFAAVGIAMIVGSFILLHAMNQFEENAYEVPGVITDIKEHYDSDDKVSHDVYVKFWYDGEKYEGRRISSYSSDMYVGEEITLLYNPAYPTRLDVKGAKYWLFGILCGMGVIFLLVGSVYPVIMIIKSIKKKNLLRNGMALSATVEEIRWDTSLTVMGRHPYVIICSYHNPGKDVTYRFKSEGIWTNPEEVYPVGSSIEVMVDVNNYKNYYVKAQEKISEKIVDYT